MEIKTGSSSPSPTARVNALARGLPLAQVRSVAVFLAIALPASSAPQAGLTAPAVPTIAGCKMFPDASSPLAAYNATISHYPVNALSDTYMATYHTTLHANFGFIDWAGMPYNVVPANQPMVPITFTKYAHASDPGPYPIPPNPKIEGRSGGRDHHLIVLQQGTCELYEMWQASYSPSTGWTASNGAKFNLTTGALRPLNWTSADAAGTPILAGVIRCGEMREGVIRHAVNLVIPGPSQYGYILPATHWNDTDRNPDYLPMGARIRLKESYDISRLTGQAHIIAVALQRYGALVTDTGPQYLQLEGEPSSTCWNESELAELDSVQNTDLEVVQTGPVHVPYE
jgi:hypothetical protein